MSCRVTYSVDELRGGGTAAGDPKATADYLERAWRTHALRKALVAVVEGYDSDSPAQLRRAIEGARAVLGKNVSAGVQSAERG